MVHLSGEDGDAAALLAVSCSDVGGAVRALLRFSTYRGPAGLLSVLVREGDLNARSVPLADLAKKARAGLEEGGSRALDEGLAVDVLSALTEVWASRVVQVTRRGDEVLPEEGPRPAGLDAEIGWAVRTLRSLEEREASVVKRPAMGLSGARLGSGEDLLQALKRLAFKRSERARVVRLWPKPGVSPLLGQARRLLGAIRRCTESVEVVPEGLDRAQQVAAVQVALELCRKGRVGLSQRVPYGQILAGRREAMRASVGEEAGRELDAGREAGVRAEVGHAV